MLPQDTKTQCQVISTNRSGRKELRNILFLGFVFMLSFSAIQALQNMQSSLNQEDGLGVLSLASRYAVVIAVGMFTPVVIRAIGAKSCFMLAWISHCLYVAANFYPSWLTILPASIFMGLIQSILWSSQAVYVATRGVKYAELTGRTLDVALSLANGLFFALFNASMLVGNLISSLVLDLTRRHVGEHNSSTSKPDSWTYHCGSRDCPGPKNTTSTTFIPYVSSIYILLAIFLITCASCLLLTGIFLEPLDITQKPTFLKSLVSCYRLFWTDVKIVLLIPFIACQSIVAVIVFAEFTKSYVACSLGVHMVGFVMAAYGAASAVSSAVQGRLVKYTGRRTLLISTACSQLSMLSMMLWWTPNPEHLHLYFLIAIVFGAADGLWHPQAYSFVALVFGERRDAAFYNLNNFKSAGYAVQFLLSHYLCVSTKLVFAAVFLAVSMVLYVIVEAIFARTKDTHDETKRPRSPNNPLLVNDTEFVGS